MGELVARDSSADPQSDDYERRLRPRRRTAAGCAPIRALRQPSGELPLLAALLAFSTHAVVLAEGVDEWLQRSGRRCVELGHHEAGHALLHHPSLDVDDHRLLVEDSRRLIAAWNAQFEEQLDGGVLLRQAIGPGVDRLLDLRESVIAGPHPYTQLAIDLEVSLVLSNVVGPTVIDATRNVIDRDLVPSYLSHVVRTGSVAERVDRQHIAALLARQPDEIDEFVRVGQLALSAFTQFLDDCWSWANRTAASVTDRSQN